MQEKVKEGQDHQNTSPAANGRWRILAVDDDPRNLKIIQEIIEDEDQYDLQCASSGEEALRMAEAHRPHLVLLDIMMPGLDGHQVCARLRAIPDLAFLKIILVSGKDLLVDRLEGYKAGADDYITKPFADEEFLSKIKVYLRLTEAENKLKEFNDGLEREVRLRTEQLLKQEKLAFLGMHLAEIAHNIKNPLSILKIGVELLKKKYQEDELLTTMDRGLQQILDMIISILQSAKQGTSLQVMSIDFNQLIKNELEFFKANQFFREKVHIELDLTPHPPFAGQYTHFSQCLHNLIANSLDAMMGTPEPRLQFRTIMLQDNLIIEIRDNGEGVPQENLEKIFHVFFSTRSDQAGAKKNSGTGLGLSYCKKMIESYGGKIQVDSQLGQGTCMRIQLPVKDGTFTK